MKLSQGTATLIAVALAVVLVTTSACTSYYDRRTYVIITSDPGDATIFLVPRENPLPNPLDREKLLPYARGQTSARKRLRVAEGLYWLVLEKNGLWSDPVELKVRTDYMSDVHVEFGQ